MKILTREGETLDIPLHRTAQGASVLVVDDRAIGPSQAKLLGYRILQADEAERAALIRGGYRLPDAAPTAGSLGGSPAA